MAKQQAKWLSVQEAWQKLEELAPKAVTNKQSVGINQAAGQVLAESLRSTINLPPADNSAMDGFAVRYADINQGKELSISQRIPAGTPTRPLEPNTAARIFTGSEIPLGADTVVMQENCTYNESSVCINQLPQKGANIRIEGNDIEQGQLLLNAGHLLRPQDIGLLAATGINQVQTLQPLKIALIVTGDELIKPGEPLSPGKIYESNAAMISSQLNKWGYQVNIWYAPDNLPETISALQQASRNSDVIITIGGVSVGEEDHVKAALNNLGKTEFWKIALKPGKPFLSGQINNKPLLGLPGNPVSTFITCALFCKPFLSKMQGANFLTPRHWQVPANFTTAKPYSRQQYLRGVLNNGQAELLKKQSSAVMTSLCEADVLVVIPAETIIETNQLISVISLAELA